MIEQKEFPIFGDVIYKCPRCKTRARYTGLLYLFYAKKKSRIAVRSCGRCNVFVIPKEAI